MCLALVFVLSVRISFVYFDLLTSVQEKIVSLLLIGVKKFLLTGVKEKIV